MTSLRTGETDVEDDDELMDRLRAYEGRSVGAPSRAPDVVNQAMIRHWVEAMGDENPVYVDDDAARANGFPGVIAPPTMIQAWIMRGYRATADLAEARAAGRRAESQSPVDELNTVLDGAGFTSVVATNCEQEYFRPLVLGDRLSADSSIESVSPLKHTALGDGHFVTTLLRFTDDDGELVATMRFRILKFRPRTARAAAAAADESAPRAQRPRPALTQDNAFFFEGARQGKLLIQRCASCGTLRHPPRPACACCRSFEWDTVEASGKGTVYSYVVVHHPQIPAFDYPLPIAVVELEEGTRLVADLVDVEPEAVTVGMPVTVAFVAVDEELTLPLFRPARTG
jgi:uncharacterized protein